jgi:hypothetical protein
MVHGKELIIIFVTETWLNDNFTNNEILPKGYNIMMKDRAVNQLGGGVLIALRHDIRYASLLAGKKSPNSGRNAWRSLQLNSKYSIQFKVVYGIS